MKRWFRPIAAVLLVVVTSATKEGLLRGSSPRESSTSTSNTIVVVQSENYRYRLHANRECRKPNGDKGTRDEVNLNKNESRNSCRRKCEAMRDDCFGYSISTSGQCEVWKAPIGNYNNMVYAENVDCFVREGSIAPAVGELPYGYTEYSKYSCRTKNGSRGTNGKEWDSFKKVSEDSCRSRCDVLGQDCYGFEYSRKKCVIWHDSIGSFKDMSSSAYSCYIKNSKAAGMLPNSGVIDGDSAIDGRYVDGVVDDRATEWTSNGRVWKERVDGEGGTNTYTEIYSNKNAIELRDEDGDRIQFDFVNAEVNRCPNNEKCFKIANISSVTTTRNPSSLTSCSSNKQIEIYKTSFNAGVSNNSKWSYRLTIDGMSYFPTDDTKKKECKQQPKGFCQVDNDGILYIEDPLKRKVFGGDEKSIAIGAIENIDNDNGSTTFEFTIADLKAREWYIDTCDTYELIVLQELNKQGKAKSTCFDVKRTKVLEDRDVNLCKNWSENEVTGHYVAWYLEVSPVSSSSTAFRVFSS